MRIKGPVQKILIKNHKQRENMFFFAQGRNPASVDIEF